MVNNEEKILQILERMDARLEKLEKGYANLEQGQTEMRADIAGLTQGQTEMRADIANLTQGQAKLEQGQAKLHENMRKMNQSIAVIEVEHGQKLTALFDGNSLANDKLDRIQSSIDDMAPTVMALDVLHSMRQRQ